MSASRALTKIVVVHLTDRPIFGSWFFAHFKGKVVANQIQDFRVAEANLVFHANAVAQSVVFWMRIEMLLRWKEFVKGVHPKPPSWMVFKSKGRFSTCKFMPFPVS